MSMLAERKQKQRFNLNPRGKFWTDDTNKFGQKMLEKMGWSSGKGLGAKENGITESLKVKYKNDASGFGYKENENQWCQHEENFTKFLENLNGNSPESSNSATPKPKTSLEDLSKSSKARVHYHKFTRSKDISKISDKDLMSIFGKKNIGDNKNLGIDNQAFENYDTVDTDDTNEPKELVNKEMEVREFGQTNFAFEDYDKKDDDEISVNKEIYNPEKRENILDKYKQPFVKSKFVLNELQGESETNKNVAQRTRDPEEDIKDDKRKRKLMKMLYKEKNNKNESTLKGIDNLGCVANTEEQKMEEAITNMNNQIDNYENEIENEINERKFGRIVKDNGSEICENEVIKKKKSKRQNKVDVVGMDTEEEGVKKVKKSKRNKNDDGLYNESKQKVELVESVAVQNMYDYIKNKKKLNTGINKETKEITVDKKERKRRKLETIMEMEEETEVVERKKKKKYKKQIDADVTEAVENSEKEENVIREPEIKLGKKKRKVKKTTEQEQNDGEINKYENVLENENNVREIPVPQRNKKNKNYNNE